MSNPCYNSQVKIGDSLSFPIIVKVGHAIPYNIIRAWEKDWRKDNNKGLSFLRESSEVGDGEVIITRHYMVTNDLNNPTE